MALPAVHRLAPDEHRAEPVGFGVTICSAARVVPGDQWIASDEAARESWWLDALRQLDGGLRRDELMPGALLERLVLTNERDRTVTLFVETTARSAAGDRAAGLPPIVLEQTGGLGELRSGGDLLRTPPQPGRDAA